MFHGRSMDFDDLRPYTAGDEIKDIDWKATARHGQPLTKRYIATRKATLVLVVDTGRNMAARAESGEVKSDLAILAAGTAGYLATRHGDLVALVAGTRDHTEFVRPESTEAHLERILQRIKGATTLDSEPSDLSTQLRYVAKSFRRRLILLVIADDRELREDEQKALRRLSVQHEILWITIGDADLMREDWSSTGMRDVADSSVLPSFVRADPSLRAEFAATMTANHQRAEDLFESLSISSQRVGSEADVVPGLFRLLEVHRHARR